MKDKIVGLIQLQGCDNRISKIVSMKSDGPLKVQELRSQLDIKLKEIQEEGDRLESLKNDRRSVELDIKELESKIEKSQIKLSNIKSNKEYTAALKEIEVSDKEKSRMEDSILQFMEELEAQREKCEVNEKMQIDLEKNYEKDKNEILKKVKKLEKEYKKLERERKKYTKLVDEDLLRQYDFLKERMGGQAVAPVVNGTCQRCNLGIPPQKFNELLRGQAFQTCPNCNRIIYWGDDEYYQEVLNKQKC